MKSKVIEAMEAVPSGNLMSLGKELKKRGVEYDFMLTDFMPAHYKIIDMTVCAPSVADDGALIVNGLALESPDHDN